MLWIILVLSVHLLLCRYNHENIIFMSIVMNKISSKTIITSYLIIWDTSVSDNTEIPILIYQPFMYSILYIDSVVSITFCHMPNMEIINVCKISSSFLHEKAIWKMLHDHVGIKDKCYINTSEWWKWCLHMVKSIKSLPKWRADQDRSL